MGSCGCNERELVLICTTCYTVAVTARGFEVLSTTYKRTDGTVSHW
jgi:hypothetical protein